VFQCVFYCSYIRRVSLVVEVMSTQSTWICTFYIYIDSTLILKCSHSCKILSKLFCSAPYQPHFSFIQKITSCFSQSNSHYLIKICVDLNLRSEKLPFQTYIHSAVRLMCVLCCTSKSRLIFYRTSCAQIIKNRKNVHTHTRMDDLSLSLY